MAGELLARCRELTIWINELERGGHRPRPEARPFTAHSALVPFGVGGQARGRIAGSQSVPFPGRLRPREWDRPPSRCGPGTPPTPLDPRGEPDRSTPPCIAVTSREALARSGATRRGTHVERRHQDREA